MFTRGSSSKAADVQLRQRKVVLELFTPEEFSYTLAFVSSRVAPVASSLLSNASTAGITPVTL